MTIDEPIDALDVLRGVCIRAHNKLARDSGYSVLGEVLNGLEGRITYEDQWPAHKLASSYAFFGTEPKIGGSRNGYDKRFRKRSDERCRYLFGKLRESRFGAWTCRRVDGDDRGRPEWTCRPVGPEVGEHRCRLHRFVPPEQEGDRPPAPAPAVYVGWMWERPESDLDLLACAVFLPHDVGAQLEEAAENRAWTRDGTFERTEYERDVLTAVLAEDRLEPGLETLGFIPPAQRDTFPPRFRREVFRRINRRGLKVRGSRKAWHVGLVEAVEPDDMASISDQFDEIRRNAARGAARFGGDRLDVSQVHQLMPDEDLLVAMGAEPGGGVDPAACPGPAPSPSGIDEATRLQMRWAGLMNNFLDNLEFYDDVYHLDQLYPSWEGLMDAVELFGEPVRKLPVEKLRGGDAAALSRITTFLSKADVGGETVRIGDLPSRRYDLLSISGIGEGSLDTLRRGLLETLVAWRG